MAVERRSIRRTRMTAPSPRVPGGNGAGCTMSLSGSFVAGALVQRGRCGCVGRHLHDAVVGAVGRDGVERPIERVGCRLRGRLRLRGGLRVTMGRLGEGLATGAGCGSGVVMVSSGGGLEVPSYGLDWLACCAPMRAAAAAKTPKTRMVCFIPISFPPQRRRPAVGDPDLSASKSLLTCLRPCGDGKVLRPQRQSARRGRKTTQTKRSVTFHNGELVGNRRVPHGLRIKRVTAWALPRGLACL